MGRNYGLTRREASKGMRCEHTYKRDCGRARKVFLITAITAVAVILALLFADSQERREVLSNKLHHTETVLVSYMTHGTIESEDTIFTCAAKTYEMPKGGV